MADHVPSAKPVLGEEAHGKRLQKKAQTDVAQRSRDIPYQQTLDSNVSGYQTTSATRRDLTGLPDAEKTERASQADISRLAALQGLQNIADFTTMLPEDFRMHLHENLVDENGIVKGIGKVHLTGDHPFWNWAAKKEALRMQEEFEKFKLSQIDLRTPESRAYWEAKQPQLVKKLREGLRKDRENRAILEDIGLHGVQSEKDLWTLFEYEKGFKRIPLGSYQSAGTADHGPIIGQRPIGWVQAPVQHGAAQTMGNYATPGDMSKTLNVDNGGAWQFFQTISKYLGGSTTQDPRPQAAENPALGLFA